MALGHGFDRWYAGAWGVGGGNAHPGGGAVPIAQEIDVRVCMFLLVVDTVTVVSCVREAPFVG